MKYCWTTIMVSNLEKSIAFYCDIVGLPLARRFSAGPGSEIAFLGDGETQVELIERIGPKSTIGNAVSLGFAVDSLDDALAFVAEHGIKVESGPFQPNDHIKFFYILDPDGLRIQFS